jgi:hypothetical protein
MRRLGLFLAVLAVGLALLEGAVRVLGLPVAPGPWSADEREREARSGPALQNLVHPFVGWSRRPGALAPWLFWTGAIPIAPDGDLGTWASQNGRANAFGYFSSIEDYAALERDRFAVGVFGGSVADQLAALAGDALAARLEQRLGERIGPVAVVNLAAGGYKQPQQAISLLQMILLGVPFDLVVNLDGFNEVVLGVGDALLGHHPILPSSRHWSLTVELAEALPSEERLELAGRVVGSRRRARSIVRVVEGTPLLKHSALARLVASRAAGWWWARAERLEEGLQRLAAAPGANPLATLPAACLERRDGCFDLVADVWERSSLLMQGMAQGSRGHYLHVLQPNFHASGGKPLSPEERASIRKATPEETFVPRGYQELRRRGEHLRASGVAFHDLSDIFQAERATLYVDACCHFNLRGNRILAERIADLAADLIAGSAEAGTHDAGP